MMSEICYESEKKVLKITFITFPLIFKSVQMLCALLQCGKTGTV